MKILLRNPRLRLNCLLYIERKVKPSENYHELIEFLNSLDRQLEITVLAMRYMDEMKMIALMKAFKPGTLEEIMFSDYPNKLVDIDDFVKMDQWKQAKRVTIERLSLDFSSHFHHFHHFEQFKINVESITLDDMLAMKKVFSENSNFKSCILRTERLPSPTAINKALDYPMAENLLANANMNQKTFYDLSIDIIENIVEYLDYKSQCRLRKVSRGFRNIVDRVKPSVDGLALCFNLGNPSVPVIDFRRNLKYRPGFYSQILRLDYFLCADHERKPSENDLELIELLNSLNHQLKINKLIMIKIRMNAMIALLKAAKPGTLEEIRIGGRLIKPDDITRFIDLDQWKEAKRLDTDGDPWSIPIGRLSFDFSRHFHYFNHFERFRTNFEVITLDDMLEIKKIFSENANFKYCRITAKNKPSRKEIREALGLSNNHSSVIGLYKIPNSNDILKFAIYDSLGYFAVKRYTDTN
uniref:F-box domain-containing protein n=1 Tax=Caenorhabditis tropicalis TaxID=1561998 RepID=A0A1I7UIA3_9PELO